MMATSVLEYCWVHNHSIIARALRQSATHNIDMAVEPEEEGKLAPGRLQATIPVRAKTRRKTITPDGIPGLLCLSHPGRRQTAIFLLQDCFLLFLTVAGIAGKVHSMTSTAEFI
jgi:hypothetical protein